VKGSRAVAHYLLLVAKRYAVHGCEVSIRYRHALLVELLQLIVGLSNSLFIADDVFMPIRITKGADWWTHSVILAGALVQSSASTASSVTVLLVTWAALWCVVASTVAAPTPLRCVEIAASMRLSHFLLIIVRIRVKWRAQILVHCSCCIRVLIGRRCWDGVWIYRITV
jgi:hypothetical protein